jgi:hypothetical protein
VTPTPGRPTVLITEGLPSSWPGARADGEPGTDDAPLGSVDRLAAPQWAPAKALPRAVVTGQLFCDREESPPSGAGLSPAAPATGPARTVLTLNHLEGGVDAFAEGSGLGVAAVDGLLVPWQTAPVEMSFERVSDCVTSVSVSFIDERHHVRLGQGLYQAEGAACGQVVGRTGQCRRGPDEATGRAGEDLHVHAVSFVFSGAVRLWLATRSIAMRIPSRMA